MSESIPNLTALSSFFVARAPMALEQPKPKRKPSIRRREAVLAVILCLLNEEIPPGGLCLTLNSDNVTRLNSLYIIRLFGGENGDELQVDRRDGEVFPKRKSGGSRTARKWKSNGLQLVDAPWDPPVNPFAVRT